MAKSCELTLVEFGERLREALNKKGMSEMQLGKKIGVAQSTVSTYLNDCHYPTANRLKLICEVLDVSADYLLELD